MLLARDDRAEVATEDYEPLSFVLEDVVIMKKKQLAGGKQA